MHEHARKAIGWAISGLCAGLLALPAAAGAAGVNGGTTAPSPPAGGTPTATVGALSVTPDSLLERQVAVVTGSIGSAGAGRAVWLQVRPAGQSAWTTVTHADADSSGAFAINWPATLSGQLTLRVIGSSAGSLAATPAAALDVYRRIVATWYGPGFYGNRTACGERLTKHLVGLASRTLRCGTPVSLTYNGQTLTLPVIDRGPYAGGATVDLTHAAAQELGVTETVTVGMLALDGPPIAPTDWFAPTGTTGATGATGSTLAGGATAPSA